MSTGASTDVFQYESWRHNDSSAPLTGATLSSRGSFHYAVPPRIDSRPNLQNQQSQDSSQLLMIPFSSSGWSPEGLSAMSSVSSLQLPQQSYLQQYENTVLTSRAPSPASSHHDGHYALSTPQQWSSSYARWSPQSSNPQWTSTSNPARWTPSTIPRGFPLVQSGPEVRITTPNRTPMTLPERDGMLRSSPVRGRGVQ